MKLKRVLASALLLATLLTLPAWAARHLEQRRPTSHRTLPWPRSVEPQRHGGGAVYLQSGQDTPRISQVERYHPAGVIISDCTAEDCARA